MTETRKRKGSFDDAEDGSGPSKQARIAVEDQKPTVTFCAIPDGVLEMIFGYIVPSDANRGRDYKDVLSFRAVCKRTDRFFVGLSPKAGVFALRPKAGNLYVLEEFAWKLNKHLIEKVISMDASEMSLSGYSRRLLMRYHNIQSLVVSTIWCPDETDMLVRSLPRLTSMVIKGDNRDKRTADEYYKDATDDMFLPRSDRLQSITLDFTRPLPICDFARFAGLYPNLQEIRLGYFSWREGTTPPVLPTHLRVFTGPLWLLPYFIVQGDTVIDDLRLIAERGWLADIGQARMAWSHVDDISIKQRMSMIHVGILRGEYTYFNPDVPGVLFESGMSFHTLVMEEGGKQLYWQLSMLFNSRTAWTSKFKEVHFEQSLSCDALLSEAHGAVSFMQETGDYHYRHLLETIRIRIHSSETRLRGPCTLTYLEKHDMLEIQWDDRPCRLCRCGGCNG